MDSSAYEILCWGDGLYLWRVLNGLAMLANTNNLAILAMIGCLLGLLVACVRVVITGGREFPIVSVFLGAILFSALFGPKVKVVVTPLNTAVFTSNVSGSTPPGGSYVVDNVPFIAGFLGYVMSQSGVKLTSLFETAFSTPTSVGVTNGGLGKTLSYITAVRVLADPYLPPAREGVDVATQFAYWRRSMATYIHDCTIGGMNSSATSGKPDPAKMFNTANPMEGIKFASDIWHTLVFDAASPSGRRVSCSQAFDAVAGAQESLLPAAYAQVIKARYGAGGGVAVLNDALGSIGSAAANHANAYISASMINALWTSALTSGPRTGGDPTALIALRQAEEQRTSDWIGGANLFLSSMRPVMSFFEALTYAIAPFLVFMLGLGERGWRVLGSYLLLALWVQLWLPLLAVCNLFLITGMEYVAAGLATATSVVEVNTLHAQAVHWLGVGGLFVQVTPFLALALLYGGSVTATTLAGRMAGQDYNNEKLHSPDAVQPAPVLRMGETLSHTAAGGVIGGGAPVTQFSASEGRESLIASSQSVRESAMNQASAQFTSSIGDSAALQRVARMSTSFNDGHFVQTGDGKDATGAKSREQGVGYDSGSGRSTEFNNKTGSGTAIDGTAGLQAAGTGGKIAHKSHSDDAATDGTKTGAGIKADTGTSWRTGEGDSTAVARGHNLARAAQAELSSSGSKSLSSEEREALTRVIQDVKSADATYEASMRASSSWDASKNVGVNTAAMTYLETNSPEQVRADMDMVRSADPATFNQLSQQLEREMPVHEQRQAAVTAMMIGQLGAGGDGAKWSPELQERREQRAAEIIPSIFAGASTQSYGTIDPNANAHLQTGAPQHGQADSVVPQYTPDAGRFQNTVDGIHGGVADVSNAAGGAIAGSGALMDQAYHQGEQKVMAVRADNDAIASAREAVVVSEGEKAVTDAAAGNEAKLTPLARGQKSPDHAVEEARTWIPVYDDAVRQTTDAFEAADHILREFKEK